MGIYTRYKSAKVQWPIEEEIKKKDAVETVYAIDDALLSATQYAEDGNNFSGEINIDLRNTETGQIFFRNTLYELLREDFDVFENTYQTNLNDEVSVPEYEPLREENKLKHARSYRLLVRLLRAYEEWIDTDAKMSFEDLKSNPLPKTNRTEEDAA